MGCSSSCGSHNHLRAVYWVDITVWWNIPFIHGPQVIRQSACVSPPRVNMPASRPKSVSFCENENKFSCILSTCCDNRKYCCSRVARHSMATVLGSLSAICGVYQTSQWNWFTIVHCSELCKDLQADQCRLLNIYSMYERTVPPRTSSFPIS